jgi:CRISPR system Cascade subunit CasD
MDDLAGHERRGTLVWPGRSAIIGLLGAALGLRRDDADGFQALDPVRMAIGIHDEGAPMRDYHTVTTVPSAVVWRPDSRAAALHAAGLDANTTITLRDYRVGPLYAVALWTSR